MNEMQPPVCRLADEREPGPMTDERMAAIAKGLAHPARVAILQQFLECRPHIAQEIVDEFDLAQSTISEHLRILREAGLLDATPDGPRTWYCMRRGVLRQFAEMVEALTDTSALLELS
jgi:ArsR family transcriptional regulator